MLCLSPGMVNLSNGDVLKVGLERLFGDIMLVEGAIGEYEF